MQWSLRPCALKRQIELAPVSLAPLLLAASLFLSMTSLAFQTYVFFEEEGGRFSQMSETSLAIGFTLGMTLIVSLPVIFALLPLTVYFGIRLMTDLLQLKHQLGGFNIRTSAVSCSCGFRGTVVKTKCGKDLSPWHLELVVVKSGHLSAAAAPWNIVIQKLAKSCYAIGSWCSRP